MGALVVGTALPHFLKWLTALFPWEYVIYTTSFLALSGGLLMVFLVPDGPYRKPGQQLDFTACFSIFKKADFRAAAFGYFGHMWELYTFWAFVPFLLGFHAKEHGLSLFRVPFWSFWVIAVGGLACILGGYMAQRWGTKQIAATALALSGICCLVSPLMLLFAPTPLFILYLLFWGMVVIVDSPLFSTLVAHSAQPNIKGTALTMVNCIGFAITILSLQAITTLTGYVSPYFTFIFLALGPILGLMGLFSTRKKV